MAVYVLDSNTISSFQFYYEDIFPSFWRALDELVIEERVVSTDQVRLELGNKFRDESLVGKWVKRNRSLFPVPSELELEFVASIFRVRHFQQLLGNKERLRPQPLADPFVIAKAGVIGGCVVTQEVFKPNAAKIPNVCQHFNIDCIDLEEFLRRESFEF